MTDYTRERLVQWLRGLTEDPMHCDGEDEFCGHARAAADMLERDGERLNEAKRKRYTTIEPGPNGATFR